MPTTRTRRTRQQHQFDWHRIEQLLEGPDANLLAGTGYFAPYAVSKCHDLSDEQYGEMLATMREDWRRHGPEMMRKLRAGETISPKPWVFFTPGCGDPWALEEFGEP